MYKNAIFKYSTAHWILVVRRLRETTGASWYTVKDYCERRGYYPLGHRSKYVKFCNDPFVRYWTKRRG